jgi:hypothetical protein
MNVNEIDKFREDFFNKLIKEEKKKERELKLKQANCFHTYSIAETDLVLGTEYGVCSKCGHSIIVPIKEKPQAKCVIM